MKYLIYLFFRLCFTSSSKVQTVHIQTRTFAVEMVVLLFLRYIQYMKTKTFAAEMVFLDEEEKLQGAKA